MSVNMSEVPQVMMTQSPAQRLNRLTACIKGMPPVRFSSVMLVRLWMVELICFATWGLTKQEKVLFSERSGPHFTAPNSMISLI